MMTPLRFGTTTICGPKIYFQQAFNHLQNRVAQGIPEDLPNVTLAQEGDNLKLKIQGGEKKELFYLGALLMMLPQGVAKLKVQSDTLAPKVLQTIFKSFL